MERSRQPPSVGCLEYKKEEFEINFNHDTIQQLPLVLSVPQLAGILHIGRNSAYQLVNSGEIRCIHIGKNIRIPQSALLEYLENASQT